MVALATSVMTILMLPSAALAAPTHTAVGSSPAAAPQQVPPVEALAGLGLQAVPAITAGNGIYALRPRVNYGLCLAADFSRGYLVDGNRVQLWSCNGATNDQLWRWDSAALTFVNQADLRHRYCLDADTGHSGDGGRVQLWTCTGAANQRWSFSGDGLIPNHWNGKCLDADANLPGNGAAITTWGCVSKNNQHWTGVQFQS